MVKVFRIDTKMKDEIERTKEDSQARGECPNILAVPDPAKRHGECNAHHPPMKHEIKTAEVSTKLPESTW